jgi:hypothetical protein
MLPSSEIRANLSRYLDSVPFEFDRRGKGRYRVSQCEEKAGAIACSAFRAQMAGLLDALDDGGDPIVLVHRRGMGTVKTFYIVEKVS